MPETISIKVTTATHKALISRMMVRETFDQVIARLLAATERHRRARKPREEARPDENH